jgi:hypothetical protein
MWTLLNGFGCGIFEIKLTLNCGTTSPSQKVVNGAMGDGKIFSKALLTGQHIRKEQNGSVV